jgi:rubrerythrin
MSAAPNISNLTDLLAVAYQIEADAVERYTVLAGQMETHNNAELAAVFRDLARAEGIHRDEIKRLAGDVDVVARARLIAKWDKGESPEEVDLAATHYMMTPWHALQLALAGEQRALAYFHCVVEATADPQVKEMAEEFRKEESEHVDLVNRLLTKFPQPLPSWSEDLDPPISQG